MVATEENHFLCGNFLYLISIELLDPQPAKVSAGSGPLTLLSQSILKATCLDKFFLFFLQYKYANNY